MKNEPRANERSEAGFTPASLLRLFLNTRDTNSLKAAQQDLDSYAKFRKKSPLQAIQDLFFAPAMTKSRANEMVAEYKSHLESEEMALGTIGRRLAALRSLARLAKAHGAISWLIEIGAANKRAFRDRRKLSASATERATGLAQNTDARSRRDRAVLSLIQAHGLSLSELAGLDLDSYDPNPGSPSVTIKDKTTKTLAVPGELKEILDAWIEVRGLRSGGLFVPVRDGRPIASARLAVEDLLNEIVRTPSSLQSD